MTPLESALRKIVSELDRHERSHALVGGLAVSARAEPRLTRDADLVVSVATDEEAEALIRLLQTDYEVLALVEQEATGRLATVRLGQRGEVRPVIVDLLFASSGIESEIVAAAEELEIAPGVVLPVATVGHLIALKLLAQDDRRRPADADDLASLRAVASDRDWRQAERAVDLITKRDAHRGRDLGRALNELRIRGPYGEP